jgi:hypothetical protein
MRYLSDSIDRTRDSAAIRLLVIVLQTVEVFATAVFAVLLWKQLPWIPHFVARMVFFLLSLVLVVVSVRIVWGWATVFESRGLRNTFLFIGFPFFVAFYLILISSYTWGVYSNLPVNRGGRYPLTTTTLTLEHDYPLPHELITETALGYISSKPVYILEDSERFLYIVDYKDPSDWRKDAPTPLAIKKQAILRMDLQSVMDGRPRM